VAGRGGKDAPVKPFRLHDVSGLMESHGFCEIIRRVWRARMGIDTALQRTAHWLSRNSRRAGKLMHERLTKGKKKGSSSFLKKRTKKLLFQGGLPSL
jgi:hypothetical protein